VFAPLKAAYRDGVEVLERGGVNAIGKQYLTSLYSPARERPFTPRNIKAGFAATGLFPFNPNRVLKDISPPIAERSIPKIDDNRTIGYQPDESLQTPISLVSEEALMSLRNLISKRHKCSLMKRVETV
jgi:hypothetical protein